MSPTHEYIERSDRSFCDFCTDGDPTMVWALPPGFGVDTSILNQDTGELIHVAKDSDGLWSACQTCHEAILKYKQSKVRPSALRRFVKDILTRTNMDHRITANLDAIQLKKLLREHQMKLFGRLLPTLGNPQPVPDDRTGVIRARGSKEMIDATREMRERMHEGWEKRHPEEESKPDVKIKKINETNLPMVNGPDMADGQSRAVSPRRWA